MASNRYDRPLDPVPVSQIRRQLFGPQPARVVLLDSTVLLEEWLGKSVIEALEKIFLLSSNLNGTCPIPLIGVYLLTIYPELILPLTHTKSNFTRLHSALSDLQSFTLEHGKLEQARHADCCVADGVTEACRQFRRYTGNLPTNSGNFHQLEIVFMTTRQESDVKKQFVSLPDQADINIIKRIVCANISSVFNDTTMDSPDTALELMNDDFTALVDMVNLEADPISLQKFLYSWLTDNTFNTEQMQLILPSPSPVENELIIKCDLIERMINPLQLPVHDAFSLDIKSNVCKHVFPPPSKALGLQVPVFQLKVLHSIPRQSVCDSLLFGQPLSVYPTGCWKMDWDCLEKNQQMFNALSTELVKKDHVLLACTVQLGQNNNNSSVKNTGQHNNNNAGHRSGPSNCFDSIKASTGFGGSSSSKPSGYFILMPSEKSMLMKSVACGELYLPSNRSVPTALPSEESLLCIQSVLSKVEELSEFNPLDFQCGLFPALKSTSLPKSYFNKMRNQVHYQRTQPAPKKVDGGPPMNPGGRMTASGWGGNITDVRGTHAYHLHSHNNKYNNSRTNNVKPANNRL